MRITIPREVLLVEIERRCLDPACNCRMRLGLTKEEARSYNGFECERCGRRWEDALTERDVPEWWEELTITDMQGLRGSKSSGADEAGEVLTRMSENYRRILEEDERVRSEKEETRFE